LDDKLKALMQELGSAINESLADSDRIAAAIGEIKRAGYDVFLVLEATIGFNKREAGARDAGDEDEPSLQAQVETEFEPAEDGTLESTARIKFTTQDQKFLRALKIAVDEDGR
jgi:hypothetical protein